METLPCDILYYKFIKILDTNDFIFTCKYVYNCYYNKRTENSLIQKRFGHIKERYDNHIRNNNLITIAFDRMNYVITPQRHSLYIYYKLFCHESVDHNNITVSVIRTHNNWATNGEFKISHKISDITQNLFYMAVIPLDRHGNYHTHNLNYLYDMWFCFKVEYNGNTYYDNNNEWNFTVSKKHNWIPTLYTIYEHNDENCTVSKGIRLMKWCLSDPIKSEHDKD